jgi:hypothetical protein
VDFVFFYSPYYFHKIQSMNQKATRLFSIFLLAFILLNFPFLGIFNKLKWLSGIPVLYLYLFIFWFILIILYWRLADAEAPSVENDKKKPLSIRNQDLKKIKDGSKNETDEWII